MLWIDVKPVCLYIRSIQCTHDRLQLFQDLDEPGEDTSKFDVFAPTVVKPKTSSMSMVSVPGLEVSDESEVTALFSLCKTKKFCDAEGKLFGQNVVSMLFVQ